MSSSLEKLVSNLKLQGEKEGSLKILFKHTYSYFKSVWSHLPEETFEFLTRKGVYPYSYMDSWDRLKERKLPPKESYYNCLTRKHISEDDYDFAQIQYSIFKLKNLKELHNLYMETDVALLADVFEAFKSYCLTNYKLDPSHFFTAPSLSWSAALKYTKIELELLRDATMSLFIDKLIVGGISLIGHQFGQSNNHYDRPNYKPGKDQAFIVYLDCNNQYGWAMKNYLPSHGFEWVENTDLEFWKSNIMNFQFESNIGYFFEVDLTYPPALHDLHDTYPLAPEHTNITESMLSSYQRMLAEQLGSKVGGKKLCLTLEDKKHYRCHYMNLQLYLQLGLELTKVHRVLKFCQSPWLDPYIELNTKLRQSAKSKFEADQAKLMICSVFGKTCKFFLDPTIILHKF